MPSGAADAAIAQARQVYGNEGFLSILRFRWHQSWSLIIPLETSALPRTAGLMCVGMAAWRSGILRQPTAHRAKLAAMLAIGLSLGGALTLNQIRASSSGSAFWPAMLHSHVDASVLLAFRYVAGALRAVPASRLSVRPH